MITHTKKRLEKIFLSSFLGDGAGVEKEEFNRLKFKITTVLRNSSSISNSSFLQVMELV